MRAKSGTRACCLVITFMSLGMPAHAATAASSTLYKFKGAPDAAYSYSPLVADAAGNLYGTSYEGGSADCSKDGFIGCGTVFELSAGGTETVLHSFQGGNDGLGPYAGLILDQAGNLYGTTIYGGGNTSCYPIGCGTIFRLAPDGTITILHAFAGTDDGAFPEAGLTADGKGNFYGTATNGGIENCFAQLGCGVAFELTADGIYKVVHEFTGEDNDGSNPASVLLPDGKGGFYGTAGTGGDAACSQQGSTGCGTVFRLKPDGTEKTLYAFEGGTDGRYPYEGVVADKAGNLYGTTYAGGGIGCFDGFGCGTVFKVTPDGKETVLREFSGRKDGEYPYARPVLDKDGDLFGASQTCNAHCAGAVFELTPRGRLIVLHDFEGKKYGDGVNPYGGLMMDAAGNLFGTTVGGGAHDCGGYGCGTIYEIKR